MKTIKQIAEEMGISKQQLYRYIKKHKLGETKNRVMYINDVAETQVKHDFLGASASSDAHQSESQNLPVDSFVDIMINEMQTKNLLMKEQIQVMKELKILIKKQSNSKKGKRKNTSEKNNNFIEGRAIPKTMKVPIRRLYTIVSASIEESAQRLIPSARAWWVVGYGCL